LLLLLPLPAVPMPSPPIEPGDGKTGDPVGDRVGDWVGLVVGAYVGGGNR
jgi:hypothetical protein